MLLVATAKVVAKQCVDGQMECLRSVLPVLHVWLRA